MSEPKPDTMMLMGNINTTGECVTMRSEMEDLGQVIDLFDRFLKAVGFRTSGQRLILIDDELLMKLEADSDENVEAMNRIREMYLTKPPKETK